NATLREHLASDAVQDLAKRVILDCAMINQGAVVLAEPDEHHLHQTALDVAHKSGVRFDAAAHDHVLSPVRMTVEVDRKPFRRMADNFRLHARANGTPAELLGDPVRLDNLSLAFGGAPSVTAHCRHDEGECAELLHVLYDRANDQMNVAD